MSVFIAVLMIMVLAVMKNVPTMAQELGDDFQMIDQAFHTPNAKEIEKYREMVYELDLTQSVIERFAFRCEGFLISRDGREHFVSIHAVDKERNATRHIVRRTFTDDDDPRLQLSIEAPNGYGDSRVDGPALFPISSDKLRLGDKIYFNNDEASGVDKSKLRFTGQDRNFDPITSAFLPYSVFFNGDFSKRPVRRIFLIDKLAADAVSTTRDYFITKTRRRDVTGDLVGQVTFMGFRKGMPVAIETWFLGWDKSKAKLQSRTLTTWERVEEFSFPVRIEATQVIDGKTTDSLEATFSWRFESDVPDRLFQIEDVKSMAALRW